MGTCEACGNDYDKSFELTAAGQTHTFDSFECAIHTMAPRCEHCGVTVIGHGVEAEGRFFCCAHCAQKEGHEQLVDRTG
jgi:Rieske Fe-S protein